MESRDEEDQNVKLAVVIVHYRTEKMTLDCLISLTGELRKSPGRHAFVVDNASGDGSAERLEAQINSRGLGDLFTFLSAPANGGFSAGNNLAIRAALSGNSAGRGGNFFDALLLLNSDTIVHPGAIDEMANRLQSETRIGVVGPRLEWSDGQQQASCFRYISPMSEMISAAKTGPITRAFRASDVLLENVTEEKNIEWISFACVLVRREVFESIGLLDEGYFMYFEDVDFCRRARNDGWKIAFEPAARVVHLRGGASPEDFDERERRRRPQFYYAARSRYLAKYYGAAGPCTANLLWLTGRSISLLREIFGRKKPHTAAQESRDIWTACWSAARTLKASGGAQASLPS
ncbi:MAG: glycosyltransferase family 2 protein [Planctomycetaceae bacterium]